MRHNERVLEPRRPARPALPARPSANADRDEGVSIDDGSRTDYPHILMSRAATRVETVVQYGDIMHNA
jgi:hypothetical protein